MQSIWQTCSRLLTCVCQSLIASAQLQENCRWCQQGFLNLKFKAAVLAVLCWVLQLSAFCCSLGHQDVSKPGHQAILASFSHFVADTKTNDHESSDWQQTACAGQLEQRVSSAPDCS